MVQHVKNMPANAEDAGHLGSIPGSGRSPGIGNDNPLHYSCLENSMDRRAWRTTVHGVAESDMTEHARTHTHIHNNNCFKVLLKHEIGSCMERTVEITFLESTNALTRPVGACMT